MTSSLFFFPDLLFLVVIVAILDTVAESISLERTRHFQSSPEQFPWSSNLVAHMTLPPQNARLIDVERIVGVCQ
jgi:hypothetical protein